MGAKPTVCHYCGEPGSRSRRVIAGVDGIRSHAVCRPPEYRKAQAKAWQDANPEKVAGYKAKWYARTADERRAQAKAAVRELLCQRCNLVVGVIEAAGRDVLAAIGEYLEVHSGRR